MGVGNDIKEKGWAKSGDGKDEGGESGERLHIYLKALVL